MKRRYNKLIASYYMKCFNPDMLRPGDLFMWLRSRGQRKRTYLDQQYKMFSSTHQKYFNCTTSCLINIDYHNHTYTFINESLVHSIAIPTVAQHKFLREFVLVCIGRI